MDDYHGPAKTGLAQVVGDITRHFARQPHAPELGQRREVLQLGGVLNPLDGAAVIPGPADPED